MISDYDYYVTIGRAQREALAFEYGFVVGLLRDYLTDKDVRSYYDPEDDHYLIDSARDAAEEGYAQRDLFTAEDLYVWAWGLEHDWLDIFGDEA